MARPGKGRKENNVEAHRPVGKARIAHDEVLGGADEAPPVDVEQGVELVAGPLPGLDLDEDDLAEALGNQVDLAQGRLVAPLHHAEELQTQVPGGDVLAAATQELGREPPRAFGPRAFWP